MEYVLVKAIVNSLYIVMKVVKVENILETLGSKEDSGSSPEPRLSVLVVELASFSIVGCVVMTVLFLLNE